jgi:5-methylcytosine-specific restriction endonuclease McrA
MRKARKRAPGEYDRRRRADKIKRLRPTILERWGWRCYLCERPITVGPQETTNPGALTLDHVVPITAGGRDTEDNLRPAHRACNEDKGERYPAWWELRQAGMVA